jgi:hypothetical protein
MEGLGRERMGLGVGVLLDMDTAVRSFFPHDAARFARHGECQRRLAGHAGMRGDRRESDEGDPTDAWPVTPGWEDAGGRPVEEVCRGIGWLGAMRWRRSSGCSGWSTLRCEVGASLSHWMGWVRAEPTIGMQAGSPPSIAPVSCLIGAGLPCRAGARCVGGICTGQEKCRRRGYESCIRFQLRWFLFHC